MKRALCVVALVGLVACRSTTVTDSGIEGIVMLWPVCPVEAPGCPEGNERPFQTALRIMRGSEVAATITSGLDGRFRVALEPGVYTIVSGRDSAPPTLEPKETTVRPGRFTDVELRFDSGIR